MVGMLRAGRSWSVRARAPPDASSSSVDGTPMTSAPCNTCGRSRLGSADKQRSNGVNLRLAVSTAWPGRWAIDAPDNYVLADDSQARSSRIFKRSVLRRQPVFRQGISRTTRHSPVRCDRLQSYPGVSPGDMFDMKIDQTRFPILQRYPGIPPGDMPRTCFRCRLILPVPSTLPRHSAGG